jgi:dihydrolipoamide dehydrogenase
MSEVEVRVPNLGDYTAVDVVEVHVVPGDSVAAEAALITLETDKATMDVPAPSGGVVRSVAIAVGDKVSSGDLVATLTSNAAGRADGEAREARKTDPPGPARASPGEGERPAVRAMRNGGRGVLLVLGAGPGGYTSAFRAADLGLDVVLVERWPTLGGVCLNVGCIPSKALLHAARVIEEAAEMGACGITFGAPAIDRGRLVEWKNRVVGQLTKGLEGLARQRNVRVVRGTGRFVGPHEVRVEADGAAPETVAFDQCIIAAGSEAARLPGIPEDPRIIDSTAALELDLPERLLVVGGGIIGLEMATVYSALGVRVTVVELTETLMPGCDPDLVKPLAKRIASRYEAIMLATRVASIEAESDAVRVRFEGKQAPAAPQAYDRVLIAVGRRPNGARISAERAGVAVDDRGFIAVDKQMRTNVGHIFAIGDIVGPPMLAHKASHEGKVAAEVAAGLKSHFDARAIPSVAYTDPEIAWVGLTETDAASRGTAYEKGVFPWAASGRALSLARADGLTKLLFDPQSKRLLGAGIVGTNAGDLIAEATLAIEMGSTAEDVGLTIHPHPTLSETLAFAAEAAEGTITDLYLPKR